MAAFSPLKHGGCPLSLESFTNCANPNVLLDADGYCLQCKDLGKTVRAAGHPTAQQAAMGSGGTIIAQRDIVTFLQQLVRAKVLTDEGEKYLQLTQMFGDTNTMIPVVDRELNGKGNRLIVRDCYDKMGNDILKSIGTKDIQRVYVTGTPGTGKSTFRNYLAWMILQKFKAVGQAVRIAMHKGGEDQFYLLCLIADGSFRVEDWTITEVRRSALFEHFTLGVNFFGLSDVAKGNDAGCEIFTDGSIIFSSPNDKTWQQGGKANCEFFYMPLWEKEELCRFDIGGKFKSLFEKYGGVARVVWGSKKSIGTHVNRLDEKLINFKELQTDIESESIWSKSHRFVYLQVQKDRDGNYSFNEKPKLIIQTRYLADLVAKKYVDRLIRSTNYSFNISHASVHGILFERVALLLIGEYARQCDFHIHRSTTGCRFPLFKTDLLEMPENLVTEYFDAEQFEKIIATSNNVLAIPNSDYFSGFDAALSFQDKGDKYLALLQMTTAKDHPLSKGGFDMLLRAQNTDVFKKIIIIYVLPNKDKLVSFTLQKLKTGAGDAAIFSKIPQVTMSIAIKSEGDARKRAKTDGAAEEVD